MPTSLPVPIQFRLPDGWQAAPPDEVGAPEAAFVALHPATNRPGFTTNITIDGEHRTDAVPMTEIADKSIDHLQHASESVSLSQRTEFGTPDKPGLTQILQISTRINNTPTNLVQCQVYLSMTDTYDPNQHAVIRLVLTAVADHFHPVLSDFQEFVASVHLDTTGHHN